MHKLSRVLAGAMAALALAGGACAQTAWPSRPIRIVVPFGAGSGLDVMARGFAQRLGEQAKVAVVVENKEGAGGTIGAVAAMRAPADGYTLLFTANGPFAVAPYMQEAATYDPASDFTPIAKVALIPMVLITGKNSRFQRFEDVVTEARAHPGKLDYASSGVGTPSNMNVEVIKRKLGLDIVAVPYKNTGQAMTDLISGQTALYMPSFPAALTQLKAGQARGLAIGSARRSRLMPDIPTVAEVVKEPGLEASVWYGFLAPKDLPPELAERIHAEIAKAAASPQIVALTATLGAEPVLVGPREFREQVRHDAEESRKLLQALGVKRER
ncbi:Bug family tripartite tricarboxylate transporter substrate binding protein [Variovorax sp. PBL-E5]|uniref:Bug family tripartite tricarboxylate transporter substrate binding protein n=1 Tax=Variovorax sp. PBL-E5 TaxID=434014 RepID=UPI0013162FFB|nr:tripartite tricarboxylate transporter substrate binding protein [Variovorax sp. PBL-E5]VTU30663.1 Argininosuccinate lyase [Variovorax sp. PBL-E5]